MKKYLFLFFLFGLYIGIKCNYQTQNVSLNIDEKFINLYKIEFNNGINSYKLSNLLNEIIDDVKFEKINDNSVSCTNINICLKQVFDQNDKAFEENYIATGFVIKSIELIAYKEEMRELRNKYNINVKIIN